jgi:hypothetical protein
VTGSARDCVDTFAKVFRQDCSLTQPRHPVGQYRLHRKGDRVVLNPVADQPAVVPDDGPDHPLLGSRLPDLELAFDGRRLWASELFHNGRGVLLSTDSRYLEVAQHWSDRTDATAVPELPGLTADAVLVRPDGQVCWVAQPGRVPSDTADNTKRLESALRTWFGRANQ